MLKTLLVIISFLFSATVFAETIPYAGQATSIDKENVVAALMVDKTTTGAGAAVSVKPAKRTIHAKVEGTGAVTATVRIQVSNDGTTWIDATTTPHIALSGTTSAVDGFVMDTKWAYIRAYVDAISGTSAKVTVYLGV